MVIARLSVDPHHKTFIIFFSIISMFKLNDDRENNTKFKTLTLLARLHFQSHGPSAITEACKGHSLKIKSQNFDFLNL